MENEGEAMPGTRKNYSPTLKAKVAVEAIKGQRTTTEIAQTFGVHPNLVANWKKLALALLPELFIPQTPSAQLAQAAFFASSRLSRHRFNWPRRRGDPVVKVAPQPHPSHANGGVMQSWLLAISPW